MDAMNRSELTGTLADRAGVSRAQAGAVLDALEAVLGEELKAGRKISLSGFLTAETVERAARTGRNPRTGEELQIAASTGVKLTPGSRLKAAVTS